VLLTLKDWTVSSLGKYLYAVDVLVFLIKGLLGFRLENTAAVGWW
jgi:hypothetical protein